MNKNNFIEYLLSEPVALTIVSILMLMSVLSWYVILKKYLVLLVVRWRHQRLEKFFQQHKELKALMAYAQAKKHPSAQLLSAMIYASLHYRAYQKKFAASTENYSHLFQFIEKNAEETLAKEKLSLQKGLTLLASIGALAPFVGLLGTVMSIHFALMKIAEAGNATLAVVAAPISEALILTAFGLAVALPAVLFYNLILRNQKEFFGQLQHFSYHLAVYLSTGQKLP